MVEPLSTRTAQDLMMELAVEETMLIDGIMGGGLGFLVATPKAGKSWLAMDISVCVASGRPLWGHETQKGCVLHIPLEDTYERLKKRPWLITDEVEQPPLRHQGRRARNRSARPNRHVPRGAP